MKRITDGNINTPEFFNSKFNGTFGLHDMERLRLLCKYYSGGVYVDVGCMDSIMPALLAESNPEVYALDFASEIINFLSPRFPKVKYETIETCYKLPFDDETVDYIVGGELIEHLETPNIFIDEALRVLRPRGVLAVSTPFEETISQGRIGGDQHLWAYTQNDIDSLFGAHEQTFTKDPGGKSIIVWKRKSAQ